MKQNLGSVIAEDWYHSALIPGRCPGPHQRVPPLWTPIAGALPWTRERLLLPREEVGWGGSAALCLQVTEAKAQQSKCSKPSVATLECEALRD